MNITFAITGYLPELFGGAEIYTQNLAKSLQQRGHEVSVVTLDLKHKRGYATDEDFDGVPVHRLGFVFDFRPAPFYALQFYPEMFAEARAYFAEHRPDVVHVTNAWFTSAIALAALELNIPVVATHVDFIWTSRESHLLMPDFSPDTTPPGEPCRVCWPDLNDEQFALVWKYRRELTGLLAAGYSYHHCPCPLLGEHVKAVGAAPDNVGVWPYGVPDELPELRPQKTASEKLRLAFIGRWNRIKGLDILLDAMALLPSDLPVELNLFGEQEVWNKDTYGAEQEAKVEQLDKVRIRGRFMPDQVAGVHREIDCIVTPSIWPENSPVSILESLALGTPVICADGAGMTNLITHGENGLVFISRDAADLADKIALAANSKDLLRKITAGAQCLRTVGEDAAAFEEIYGQAKPPAGEQWRQRVEDLRSTLHFADEVYHAGNMVRRVREKFATLQQKGFRRIALFGAGRHTLKLLGTCEISGVEMVAILDENPNACGSNILGIPVLPLKDAMEIKPDAVVVSSDAFEQQMLDRIGHLPAHGIYVTGFYREDKA